MDINRLNLNFNYEPIQFNDKAKNLMECTCCKIEKDITNFDKHKNSDGIWKLKKVCISCLNFNLGVRKMSNTVIDLPNEKWVKLFNGEYSISNMCRVKSYKCLYKAIIMKPVMGKRGYLSVKFDINGKMVRKNIHRVMAEAFIPNPQNKPEINHINGIKTDNRIENLEWCTRSENMLHYFKNKKACEKV